MTNIQNILNCMIVLGVGFESSFGSQLAKINPSRINGTGGKFKLADL